MNPLVNNLSKYFDYLPIRQSELDWGLYVTVAGRESGVAGSAYPQPGHPQAYNFNPGTGRVLSEWQLLYIEKGLWRFTSQYSDQTVLEPGDAAMLFPGVWHSYCPEPDSDWSDYYMGFSGAYAFDLCQNNVFTQEKPIFKISAAPEMTREFQTLLTRIDQSRQNNSPRIAAAAVNILALVQDCVENQAQSEDLTGEEQLVFQAQRIIWGWSYRSLSVQKVAKALGLNLRTLQRYFTRILGHSILEEIQNCRVIRASHLLQKTRIPIGQVALMAGFSSPLHMRRAFRRAYDLSPEQFREKQS